MSTKQSSKDRTGIKGVNQQKILTERERVKEQQVTGGGGSRERWQGTADHSDEGDGMIEGSGGRTRQLIADN